MASPSPDHDHRPPHREPPLGFLDDHSGYRPADRASDTAGAACAESVALPVDLAGRGAGDHLSVVTDRVTGVGQARFAGSDFAKTLDSLRACLSILSASALISARPFGFSLTTLTSSSFSCSPPE